MEMVKGYIVVKRDENVEIHAEPISRQDAEFIKEVLEAAGNTVYIGSEVKIFKAVRANSEMVNSSATVILKAS